MKAFGKYENLELIGTGATADVYLAQDKTLARPVALKVLKASLVSDAQAFERFLLEARSAANLFHPHIATVLDMGETEGRFYIAMRYYKGQSLQERLVQEGRLSWDENLRLAEQIGSALDYAHEQGLLHRDVKPSNILSTMKGDFVLTDFGLTRAMMNTGLTSHTGAILGTPAYIAPEIWAGRAASPATDQYSLACVIAECLSGRRLFQGETPPEIMTRHMLDGPQFPGEWPEGVPVETAGILERALHRKVEARWEDCGCFFRELHSLHYQEKRPKSTRSEYTDHQDQKISFDQKESKQEIIDSEQRKQDPIGIDLDMKPHLDSGINESKQAFHGSAHQVASEVVNKNKLIMNSTLWITAIQTVFIVIWIILYIFNW